MTAQIAEILITDDIPRAMTFCPPLPESHPRIVDVSEVEPPSAIFGSTACWRGYQGVWQIRHDRLYLVGFNGGKYRLEGEEPLLADWFTGVLRIPRGEMLHYVHMGFGSVHEEEIHIKIEKGVVMAQHVVDNRGKEHDLSRLGFENLPGKENRFPGDDDL